MRVVDTACGLGNNFGEFVRRGFKHFQDDPRIMVIEPKECLGIDTDKTFRADLEDRGYQFLCCPEILSLSLPETDYILCWDHLDRLPGILGVKTLMGVMLDTAKKGIWIRLRTQEQDVREVLLERKFGLRFTWDDQTICSSACLLQELVKIINDYRKEKERNSISVRLVAGQRVYSTDDTCLVPIGSPAGTRRYDQELGPKPELKFDPPLVASWELIIHV